MKYDVTYSCGHTGTVELYGKTSERESKIRWYETTAVCPECYKKQQQEAAAETTTKYELPELEGSEKQLSRYYDMLPPIFIFLYYTFFALNSQFLIAIFLFC